MYSGPHIKRDGLVFGYDTGYGIADNSTATRFYPGKPTENLLALAGADTDLERSGDGSGYSYHGVNITSYVQSRWSSSNNRLVQSFEGKRDYSQGGTGGGGDGYPRMYVYFTDWSWSSSFGITSYDWSYSKQIFTMPDPTGKTIYMNIYHMNNGNPGRSYSRKHSVAFNTIDTPYSNGTRSSTQSLIDLTKSTNIDVSNVSFDSTGQPTFDGTDDYIDLPNNLATTLNGNPEASINMWIKLNNQSNGVADTGLIQLSNYNNSNGNLYFYSNGYTYLDIFRTSRVGQVFANNTVTATDWHMLTITTTPGANGWKCYINGEFKSSTTGQDTVSVNSSIQGGLTLGRNNSSRYTNGTIAVCAIYNRALSADEVKQNFKAYKNRFDI